MLTKGLSRFITNTGYHDLPQEAVTAAKWGILDHIGVALVGSQEPAGKIISELAKENKSATEATVIGNGFKASCSLAALANGTFAHALDYDDCLDLPPIAPGHPRRGFGHPGTTILPAAIAVSEKLNTSGKELILAYSVGLEVYSKVGILVGAFKTGLVPTPLLGVIGAAAAVAKFLRLNEHQVNQSFGIAASLAAGLGRNFGTMTNPLHGGNAARNGVEAAFLAQKGFTSWEDILEAPSGYYNIFTGSQDKVPDSTQEEIIKSLGNPWNILSPGLMFKAYPCAHISHFAVDGGLELRRKYSIDWRQIAEVEIRVVNLSRQPGLSLPRTGLEGKFSREYCFSRALIDGRVRIPDFTNEKVSEPQVKELMSKIKWAASKTEKVGGTFAPLEFEVKLKDGTSYSCKIVHPKGEPQNPPSKEELIAKYEDCAAHAQVDKEVTSQIKDLVLNLEKVENVSRLSRLLMGRGKGVEL